MQINNLGGALELRLNQTERILLSNAVRQYAELSSNRRALAVISAIQTTLNAIDPDGEDTGSLYVGSVDRGLLSDALRFYSTRSPKSCHLPLQGMIAALDVAGEVAG